MHFPFKNLDSLRADISNHYLFLESVGFTVVNSRTNPFNLITRSVIIIIPIVSDKEARRKQAQRRYYLRMRYRRLLAEKKEEQNQVDQPREAGINDTT
jgi:hypothetical protein